MKKDPDPDQASSETGVDIRTENLEPPPWIPALERYVLLVLKRLELTGREVSFLLTDDSFMQDLNRQYRSLDEPTDVLSFGGDDFDGGDPSGEVGFPPSGGDQELSGPAPALGDVVIDLPYVERQARRFSVPLEEELRRVTVHALLHLAGHTHETRDFSREPMLQLQEKLVCEIPETLF
ncbi:probable rRNA maturation factor [Alkalispirochaeta americana]|uniref:Endoribonuclease YbeY n=1 Tax=Alkalispirochaeta americana TaxID=159291 RepID=A0A1N6P304_9SPIO|nr:rRNA maturation RNase YbeY [Alkalispirochaeta americana]SIP98764.1 probable rRNA maturation factor [Alkalispirochaeta americana]